MAGNLRQETRTDHDFVQHVSTWSTQIKYLFTFRSGCVSSTGIYLRTKLFQVVGVSQVDSLVAQCNAKAIDRLLSQLVGYYLFIELILKTIVQNVLVQQILQYLIHVKLVIIL